VGAVIRRLRRRYLLLRKTVI
jgi:hypothetical protein